MNFIQNTITILSGILAISFLIVILLAEATTEVEITIPTPAAISPASPTGGDKTLHSHITQKTTKPYFPILYQFFHPQTVKK
jgi:hypothetical protein